MQFTEIKSKALQLTCYKVQQQQQQRRKFCIIVRDLGGERRCCCFIIPIGKTLEKSAQVALRQVS